MRKKDTLAVNTTGSPAEVAEPPAEPITKPRTPTRSNSAWFTKQPMVEEPEELVSEEVTKATVTETGRPRPNRSATLASFWPVRLNSKEEKELPQRPPHSTAKSDTAIAVRKDSHNQVSRSPSRPRSNTTVTTHSGSEGGEGKTSPHHLSIFG